MKKNSLNFFINRRVIISLIVLALILIGHYSGLLNPLEGAVFSAAKPLNKIFYSREKEDMRKKVREICLEYGVTTKEWYSHMDMSINFHGNNDDVERMLNELSKYKSVVC